MRLPLPIAAAVFGLAVGACGKTTPPAVNQSPAPVPALEQAMRDAEVRKNSACAGDDVETTTRLAAEATAIRNLSKVANLPLPFVPSEAALSAFMAAPLDSGPGNPYAAKQKQLRIWVAAGERIQAVLALLDTVRVTVPEAFEGSPPPTDSVGSRWALLKRLDLPALTRAAESRETLVAARTQRHEACLIATIAYRDQVAVWQNTNLEAAAARERAKPPK